MNSHFNPKTIMMHFDFFKIAILFLPLIRGSWPDKAKTNAYYENRGQTSLLRSTQQSIRKNKSPYLEAFRLKVSNIYFV